MTISAYQLRSGRPSLWILSTVMTVVGVCSACQNEPPSLEPAPHSELQVVEAAKPAQGTALGGTHQDGSKDATSATPPANERAPQAQAREPKDSQPAASAPEVDAAATLSVKRAVLTTAIHQREPLEAATLSVGGEPIIAFVEMANAAAVDQNIVITFEHEDGAKVGFVTLKIPAQQKRWRTWGQTRNVRSPGRWTAHVSTEDGQLLESVAFDVQSEPSLIGDETSSTDDRAPAAAKTPAATAEG